MAEIKQKIAALKKKILTRENKLAKLNKRISDSKHDYKIVSKEIDGLNEEIRRLELEQLSVTLEQNGITADDIAAAIAEGSIKKTLPEAQNVVSGEGKNGDTYITENSKKEDTVNEVSGS